MSFIETIPEQHAGADVLAMYERQSSFFGYLPNYARVFSHRPEVMRLWADLQNGVRKHMDRRRFEIITFVAAHTLRSTLCSLAHGKALAKYLSKEDVLKLARGEFPAGFRLRLHEKDLRICREMAARHGAALPVVEATLADYAVLLAAGHGDEDISTIFRLKAPLFARRATDA